MENGLEEYKCMLFNAAYTINKLLICPTFVWWSKTDTFTVGRRRSFRSAVDKCWWACWLAPALLTSPIMWTQNGVQIMEATHFTNHICIIMYQQFKPSGVKLTLAGIFCSSWWKQRAAVYATLQTTPSELQISQRRRGQQHAENIRLHYSPLADTCV